MYDYLYKLKTERYRVILKISKSVLCLSITVVENFKEMIYTIDSGI